MIIAQTNINVDSTLSSEKNTYACAPLHEKNTYAHQIYSNNKKKQAHRHSEGKLSHLKKAYACKL